MNFKYYTGAFYHLPEHSQELNETKTETIAPIFSFFAAMLEDTSRSLLHHRAECKTAGDPAADPGICR